MITTNRLSAYPVAAKGIIPVSVVSWRIIFLVIKVSKLPLSGRPVETNVICRRLAAKASKVPTRPC